MHLTYPAFGRL